MDRTDDTAFSEFVQSNHQAIFELFDFLEAESSYYVKRESLKTEYSVLVKYEVLREIYVNDDGHLRQIMKEVVCDKKGI